MKPVFVMRFIIVDHPSPTHYNAPIQRTERKTKPTEPNPTGHPSIDSALVFMVRTAYKRDKDIPSRNHHQASSNHQLTASLYNINQLPNLPTVLKAGRTEPNRNEPKSNRMMPSQGDPPTKLAKSSPFKFNLIFEGKI